MTNNMNWQEQFAVFNQQHGHSTSEWEDQIKFISTEIIEKLIDEIEIIEQGIYGGKFINKLATDTTKQQLRDKWL